MADSPLSALAEDISDRIGAYTPDGLLDAEKFIAGAPDFYTSQAEAMDKLIGRFADDHSIHPDAIEALREIPAGLRGQADKAQDALAEFRTKHREDLDRLHNQRSNEEFFDSANNKD